MFHFNPNKSVVLILENDNCPNMPIIFGDTEIEVKPDDKHMVIYIGSVSERNSRRLRKLSLCP